MGYKILGQTEDLLKGYGRRPSLEGPFIFAGGRVLYYDPKQGQYWDPRTDFYIEHEEMTYLHNELMRLMEAK